MERLQMGVGIDGMAEVTVPLPEIPGVMKILHASPTHNGRYDFADTTRELVDQWLTAVGTGWNDQEQTFCTVEFVGSLIEIVLDPTIYAWHLGETSPHYHPRLEVSIYAHCACFCVSFTNYHSDTRRTCIICSTRATPTC